MHSYCVCTTTCTRLKVLRRLLETARSLSRKHPPHEQFEVHFGHFFLPSAMRPTQTEERNWNKRWVLCEVTRGERLAVKEGKTREHDKHSLSFASTLQLEQTQRLCFLACLVWTYGKASTLVLRPQDVFWKETKHRTRQTWSRRVAATRVTFLCGTCNTLNSKWHMPKKAKNQQNLTRIWYVLEKMDS